MYTDKVLSDRPVGCARVSALETRVPHVWRDLLPRDRVVVDDEHAATLGVRHAAVTELGRVDLLVAALLGEARVGLLFSRGFDVALVRRSLAWRHGREQAALVAGLATSLRVHPLDRELLVERVAQVGLGVVEHAVLVALRVYCLYLRANKVVQYLNTLLLAALHVELHGESVKVLHDLRPARRLSEREIVLTNCLHAGDINRVRVPRVRVRHEEAEREASQRPVLHVVLLQAAHERSLRRWFEYAAQPQQSSCGWCQ